MAKLGSVTVNEIELIEVDVSPIVSGIDAADGSIAVLTDGSAFFLKIAGGPTSWQSVDKAFIGLGNADNTSDANKPVSTAQQTALNGKANLAGGNTFTGTQIVNDNFSANQITLNVDNSIISSDIGGDSRLGFVKKSGAGPVIAAGSGNNISLGIWSTPNLSGNVGSGTFSESMRVDSSGNVLIGTTTTSTSAKLKIDSTTSGFLMPRVTSTQRLAITSPAEGLQVFDTDWNTVCEYSGAAWKFEARLNTTAIQTSTSNVYANITEFTTLTLDAGLYVLELKGVMQSTATGTGVGLRLVQGTGVISGVKVNWTFSQAGAGTDKNFEYSQLTLADNVTSASVITANSDFPVFGNGIFRISTAGTIIIQLRSEVNGSGVSIRPDSTVMFKKIG